MLGQQSLLHLSNEITHLTLSLHVYICHFSALLNRTESKKILAYLFLYNYVYYHMSIKLNVDNT